MISIVLGGKSNALAIARSLVNCDGVCHVLTTTPSTICKCSRSVARFSFFNNSSEVLEELSKYDVVSKKILYPTSDLWANFISINAGYLRSRGFFFLTVPFSIMSLLLDKYECYKKFRNTVLMPETVLASFGNQLAEGKSFIVKPRRSFVGDIVIEKGFRSSGENGSDFVVQEKLSMDLRNHFSVSGIAVGGDIFFRGLTNKVLEHPRPGGTATLVISSKVDPTLREKAFLVAEQIIRAVEYSGVFEVELILHEGEFWFIELNPRFWLQHEIFSAMDINISALYMQLSLGSPVKNLKYKDCNRLVWMHEGVGLSLLTNQYSVLEVVRDLFFGKKVIAHWRLSDIKPFFMFLYEMLCKRS